MPTPWTPAIESTNRSVCSRVDSKRHTYLLGHSRHIHIQIDISHRLDVIVSHDFGYFNHDDIALSIYIQDFQSACIVGLHLATIEESSITKGRQEQGIGNDNAGNDNASDHDDSLNSLNVPDSLNVPTCVLSKLFQPFHVTFWNRTQDPRCIPKVQR
jgi:hypothetical protein